MSERKPTAEQRAAIEATAAEVMVEAGAGTGKTGVMVDRYCRLVCERGVSPDAVLAFTFTDKAAAELRQRIRAEIERRAEGSERARELLPRLGSAWVTTIHGFCNRLLSAHPVAVGIDPRFRVLDAPETERAAGEAFDEALEIFLAAGDRSREETAAAFDIGGLRAMVIGAHAELRSRGATEPRLPEPPRPDVQAALRDAAAAAAEALPELKPGSANHDLVERALALLGESGEMPSLDQIAALRTASKAKPIAAYREAVETALSRVAEAGEGGLAYRHLAELLELFSARFAVAKERRAGIDFEDLQLLAARLLERTETGASYRARFSHLLVDEFQDTNRLQLRLIEALRGPKSQLMVVGDELQSIYGFRHADLDVFRRRREAIAANPNGETLPLSGNFRSRPEVIGAVNAIGERLLAGYTPLRVGTPPSQPEPPGGGPAVEMLLSGREGWDEGEIQLDPVTDARTPANQLAEARFLAARLRELVDQGVERGSMVVLLRAFTRLDAHEDSLQRAGLRPYVVGGRGYWSQQQVADVCALLATTANPLDDQALLGTLASPACGVTPDTLWLLRAAAGRGRLLWPAVEQATGLGESEGIDTERLEQIPADELLLLSRFAETLTGLRRRATSLSLAGLIDAAVTETGYDLAVLMRSAGEMRFANVRKLMRLAADFESAEGRDLRGLLDFLAARADADADAQAATAVEGHDGVRIMTIHSAKGLEFDVVAIPHLSRGLLPSARTPLLTLGREPESPRVGMQLRRLGARGVNLYAQRGLCEEAQKREAEEELRLFHVACDPSARAAAAQRRDQPLPPSRRERREAVIERIAAAFEIDRERDSSDRGRRRPSRDRAWRRPSRPPRSRSALNLASAEQARVLSSGAQARPTAVRETRARPGAAGRATNGPDRRRPLSYTAISAHGEGSAEGLPESDRALLSVRMRRARTGGGPVRGIGRARAARVEPGERLAGAPAGAGPPRGAIGGGEHRRLAEQALLAPVHAWLDSGFFAERIGT